MNYCVAILEAACKLVDIEQIQLVGLRTRGHSGTAARPDERPDLVPFLAELRGDRSAQIPGGAGYCDSMRQFIQGGAPARESGVIKIRRGKPAHFVCRVEA